MIDLFPAEPKPTPPFVYVPGKLNAGELREVKCALCDARAAETEVAPSPTCFEVACIVIRCRACGAMTEGANTAAMAWAAWGMGKLIQL